MARPFHFHIELRVTPSALRWAAAGFMFLILAGDIATETFTLATYYPAPSGIYNKMITTGATYLARDGGNVGIGTTAPAAALDVAGGIRPGSNGVATGGPCNAGNPEGAFAYDAAAQAPVFCGHSGVWTSMAGGDNRNFVSWNSSSCPPNFNAIYAGSVFTSAISGAGSPATDQVCTEGTARPRYRISDAFNTYQWDAPAKCALCAKPSAKFCFTHWGTAGCPAGFNAASTGYMAQAAWSGGGSSGKITCWAGARHGGIFVVYANESSYEWIPGDPCAECCN